jgi:hypothetical protein
MVGRSGVELFRGAPVLRNLLLPRRHGPVRVVDQFVLNLFQKTFHSAFFDGLKRDAIDPRCALVALGHPDLKPVYRRLVKKMVLAPLALPASLELRFFIFTDPQFKC